MVSNGCYFTDLSNESVLLSIRARLTAFLFLAAALLLAPVLAFAQGGNVEPTGPTPPMGEKHVVADPVDDRPNILFLYADDHAAHAIGAYEGRLADLNPTPEIDRLAEEGVRLENVFSGNSICTPSRATVMTGQYSHTHGRRGFGPPLPPEEQTLLNELSEADYEIGIVGKWHLGAEPAADYYAVLPGQGNYFNPILRVKGEGEWPNNTERFAGYNSQHSSDVITDLSLDWIQEQTKSDHPFFLQVGFKSPHDNFENAERHDWLYTDTKVPEPKSLWHRAEHGPPEREQYGTSVGKRNERRNMGHHMHVDRELSSEAYKRTSYQRYLKKYLRTVKGVDEGVGRIMDHLEETGQLDNTIVIYTTDQGMMLGEHDYMDKRWMYEESSRMPFVIWAPELVEAGSNDDLIHNVDVAPTILDMAGVDVPASMEGRSFLPMLRGASAPDDWRDALYYRYWLHMTHHDNPAHFGIRTERYKLIFSYGLALDGIGNTDTPTPPHWELYDLKEDPHEMYNVYHDPAYREEVERLTKKLLEVKRRVDDTDEKYPEVRERFEETSRVDPDWN